MTAQTDERSWDRRYEVTRGAIAAYCAAIGEQNPLFLDVNVARAAAFADVVAPPMFAAVFSLPAVRAMLDDDQFADDRANLLHATQTFRWTDVVVVAGDCISTAASVEKVETRGAHRFFTFATRSWRPDGREVVRGEWLTVARGGRS